MESSHTFTTSDGVTLAYWVHRAPKPSGSLVFLHGLASNHTRWSEFLDKTPLTEQWNTLRLDLRGHGHSMMRGALNMERWCSDLEELLRALQWQRCVVVGHSMGANLAAYFARQHIEYLNGLILIDPVPRLLGRRVLRMRLVRFVLAVVVKAIQAVNHFGGGRKSFPQLDLRALDEHVRATLLREKRYAEMQRLYASPLEDLKYIPSANYLQDVMQLMRPLPPLPPELPVLMLLSSAQRMTDAELNRAYAHASYDCQVVEFNANHWIMTEQPDAARAAIENWLAALRW